MSKRFWLPTHKAGDLFPKATQAPTKLVIRGIPADTPLYHAVANEFGGRLKTFHAKAQQAYANSINQVFKTQFTWSDEARATYVNIQGNEILELEVSRSVIEYFNQPIKSRSLPNWAVASFDIPIIVGGPENNTSYSNDFEIYAELRNNLTINTLTTGTGITAQESTWFKPFNIMAFAGTASDKLSADNSVSDPDQTTATMELLIDLRPFHTPEHAPAVIIDIYASAARNDPNHLYGYSNIPAGGSSQDEWITNSQIAGAPGGATQLTYLQGFWDAAGLPHDQQSYFVDNHQGAGAQELAIDSAAALSYITFGRNGNIINQPPTITQGLPNFITNQPANGSVDGWRYMVINTDPATGLITDWGFNNLIWETISGDSFPTVFTLTQQLFVNHYDIQEMRGYIDNPYRGPGNIFGELYWSDDIWVEQDWIASMGIHNWRWAQPGKAHITQHPLIKSNVLWPNELSPTTSLLLRPPELKQQKYLLGTLLIDIESASISFLPV